MQELQIFNNEEFGEIRTVIIDNIPYFVGKDVAVALGYSKPTDAVRKHVSEDDRGISKMETPSGLQDMTVVNESGLYSLIFGSKLETAKKFKRWVTSDVLPTLRKTGSYEMPKKDKQEKPKKKNLSSTNMLVKTVSGIFKEAGVNPVYIAAEAKRLYKEQADIEINIPLITDKEDMPKLYDCTEMAKELGIMSTKGKPHNQAVSAILAQLEINDDEIVKTAFSRNGHEDVTTQYKPSVYTKVENWLEENYYPVKIPYIDSKGNYKTYSVVYQEVA